MVMLSHKIRMYPNKQQDYFFRKSCGCCGVVWNILNEIYSVINCLSRKKHDKDVSEEKYRQQCLVKWEWSYGESIGKKI